MFGGHRRREKQGQDYCAGRNHRHSRPETFEQLEPDTIEDWAQTSKVLFPLVVKFADDAHPGVWNPADRYRINREIW